MLPTSNIFGVCWEILCKTGMQTSPHSGPLSFCGPAPLCPGGREVQRQSRKNRSS